MSSEECGQMIVKISVISVKLELNSQLGEDWTVNFCFQGLITNFWLHVFILWLYESGSVWSKDQNNPCVSYTAPHKSPVFF